MGSHIGDEYERTVIIPKERAVMGEYLRSVYVAAWYPYIMRGLTLIKQETNLTVMDYNSISDYEKALYDIARAENAVEYLKLARELVDIPTGPGVVEPDVQ